MRIHLVTPTLVPKDAVGNDLLAMRQVLQDGGFETAAFACSVSPALGDRAEKLELRHPRWQRSEDLLVYHHSMHWPEGQELLRTARNRKVIRYHNVTPAAYFKQHSKPHYEVAMRGVAATRQVANVEDAFFWGASDFNCEELVRLGAPRERCRTLPPLHPPLTASFDPAVLGCCRVPAVNVLFVGGFKPHKRHDRVIRVFARYHYDRNPASRLFLVGCVDPNLHLYVAELEQLVDSLGLRNSVVFAHNATEAELRSYYGLAHVFLCASEHEGFCVPLAEAMCYRVPIVAWGTTAVPETAAGCGLVWEEYDENLLAESIHEVVENAHLSRHCRRIAFERYRRTFSPTVLADRLSVLVQECERECRERI